MWGNTFQTGLMDAIGWTLVHSTWQIFIVTIGLALLYGFIQSARIRYWLGVIALMLCLVVPAVTFLQIEPGNSSTLERHDVASLITPDAETSEATEPLLFEPIAFAPPVVQWTDSVQSAASSNESSEQVEDTAWADWIHLNRETAASKIRPWIPMAVWVWLVGVILFSLRLFLGVYTSRRLSNVGVRPVSSELSDLFARLKLEMNIRQKAELLMSKWVTVPIVVGYLRPVILLPMSIVSNLSPLEIEAIIRHELAHVRRHDAAVNFVQSLIETLFFFHPCVWWISRSIRVERENCCDDLATNNSELALHLANALFQLESSRSSSAVLAANAGNLKSRIARILNIATSPQPRSRRGVMAGMAATAFVLTILCAFPFSNDANAGENGTVGNRAGAVSKFVTYSEMTPGSLQVPISDSEMNQRVYEKNKALLQETYTGKWMAIVAGEVHGPFPSLERADKELRTQFPAARHRYIFRPELDDQPVNYVLSAFVAADGWQQFGQKFAVRHQLVHDAGSGAYYAGGLEARQQVADIRRLIEQRKRVPAVEGEETVDELEQRLLRVNREVKTNGGIPFQMFAPVGDQSVNSKAVWSRMFSEDLTLSESQAQKMGLDLFRVPGTTFYSNVKNKPGTKAYCRVVIPELQVDEFVLAVVFANGTFGEGRKASARDNRQSEMVQMLATMIAKGLGGYNSTSTLRFDSKLYMRIAKLLMGQTVESRRDILKAVCEKYPQQGIILCRMLFEPKPGRDFRRPFIGEPQFVRGTKADWPLEPITIVDEVPFLVTRGYLLAGEAEPATEYLDYCLKSCDWTSRQFEPVTTYWKTAKIRSLPVFQKVDVDQQFEDLKFFIEQTENFHAVRREGLMGLLGQSLQSESIEDQKGGHEGADCLVALAKLRVGGVLDSKWEQWMKDLAIRDYDQTYALALQTLLLCELDSKLYQDKISKNIKGLVTNQRRDGSWSYKSGPTGSGDGSNTRFAIWALSTAESHDFRIPEEVWLNSALYWLGSQNVDGGWGYAKSNIRSTATMTLSGIACLGMIKNSPNTPEDRRLDEIAASISKAWERPGLSEEIANNKKWRVYGLQVLALAAEVTVIQQQSQSWHKQWLPLDAFGEYFANLKTPVAEMDPIDLSLSIIGMTPSSKRAND